MTTEVEKESLVQLTNSDFSRTVCRHEVNPANDTNPDFPWRQAIQMQRAPKVTTNVTAQCHLVRLDLLVVCQWHRGVDATRRRRVARDRGDRVTRVRHNRSPPLIVSEPNTDSL
jgi:hypothetical protein